MENTISCIIVNYNDWKRTKELVLRIVEYKIITHVIVVDNMSTDNSLYELNQIKNEKFLLLRSDKNGGYGYGNNIGIRKANELLDKYVIIANPDVFFDENCIVDMLDKIASDNKCAIINAKETHMGVSAWRKTSVFKDVLSASILFNKIIKARYYPKSYFSNSGSVRVDIIQGSFLMIPTGIMMNFGMYDEDFFLYEEEKVLSDKLSSKGFHFLTDTDVNYEHRHVEHGQKSIKQYVEGKKRLLRSKELYLKKYRNLKGAGLMLSKLFFKYTILEMKLYSFFLVKKSQT